MKPLTGYRRFTPEEIKDIVRLYDNGVPAKEIAKQKDRTTGSIHQVIYQVRKQMKNENATPTASAKPASMPKPTNLSPREMIKALYDMGYRIENNQLVCYQKQVVKVSDIISD